MSVENAPQPVRSYETPDAQGAITFLPAMRAWRRIAAWGFWLSIGAVFVFPPAAIGTLALLVVCSIGALVCMTRAAAREAGRGYATRQLVLVLFPVLFAGVFLVTRMVEADLVNWRLANRPST
jgi:hypothetical protein